jgi:hypothetical protein
MTNTLLDRSGVLASTWLLAMAYVCFILNHTYNGSICSVPMTVVSGSTPDISPLLAFAWWEPLYYKVDDSSFPSDTREKRGRFVGIVENVGNLAVVKSSTLPEAKLHKRHTLLSLHRVREAIATGIIYFIHIDGQIIPADILSKHWGHAQVWENLKPLLFWKGDTEVPWGGRMKMKIMSFIVLLQRLPWNVCSSQNVCSSRMSTPIAIPLVNTNVKWDRIIQHVWMIPYVWMIRDIAR